MANSSSNSVLSTSTMGPASSKLQASIFNVTHESCFSCYHMCPYNTVNVPTTKSFVVLILPPELMFTLAFVLPYFRRGS